MASLFSLPNELIFNSLRSRYPCRDQQIRSLATVLSIEATPHKNLVLYGLEATGKTAVIHGVLEALSSSPADTRPDKKSQKLADEESLQFGIVKCTECITGRHLLDKTVRNVAEAVGWAGTAARCENLAQFVVELSKLLSDQVHHATRSTKRRFVLVFDAIDKQREPLPTLLPALARLGELIPNLSTVFIVTSPRPNFLHSPGAPHIHFPPYTKQELLQILSLTTPSPKIPGDGNGKDTKDVWARFCAVVWDSLAKHSGRDILSMRSVCLRLWPKFIAPILEGTHYSTQFSRLLLANRSLFQSENILIPNIITGSPEAENPLLTLPQGKIYQGIGAQLPFYSRLLLVAAYLASFNPPRTDQLFFMKAAAARRRKKGGATAKIRPGVSRHRKISRKLLGPQAFILERMIAIFHAIKDDADSRGRVGKGKELTAGSAELAMGIATLVTLRLLAKVGSANSGDTLDAGTKYRVAIGWESIRGIARSVGVEADDYLFE